QRAAAGRLPGRRRVTRARYGGGRGTASAGQDSRIPGRGRHARRTWHRARVRYRPGRRAAARAGHRSALRVVNWLAFAGIVVIGFGACAEFGSYAFVHPVLRRLPQREWITTEQGLLRTFGRIMPVGMTAAPILAGLTAPTLEPGTAQLLGWLALATTA